MRHASGLLVQHERVPSAGRELLLRRSRLRPTFASGCRRSRRESCRCPRPKYVGRLRGSTVCIGWISSGPRRKRRLGEIRRGVQSPDDHVRGVLRVPSRNRPTASASARRPSGQSLRNLIRKGCVGTRAGRTCYSLAGIERNLETCAPLADYNSRPFRRDLETRMSAHARLRPRALRKDSAGAPFRCR